MDVVVPCVRVCVCMHHAVCRPTMAKKQNKWYAAAAEQCVRNEHAPFGVAETKTRYQKVRRIVCLRVLRLSIDEEALACARILFQPV